MARAAGSSAGFPATAAGTAGLALVAIVGAVLGVVFHPLIGLPVAGAALAALTFKRRVPVAVLAAIAGGVLATVFARATVYVIGLPIYGVPVAHNAPYVFAALSIISLLLAGPIAVLAVRKLPVSASVIGLAVLLFGLQIAALAWLAYGAKMGLGAYVAKDVRAIAAQASMQADMITAVIGMWPSVLLTVNGLTAFIVIGVVGAVGVRNRAEVRGLPPVSRLDLNPLTVVVPISALALIAAGRLGWSGAALANVMGNNLLVVARWVFFLQGIAVFTGLYDRLKLARPLRVMGFAFLGLAEVLFPAVSLMGLADIWLNVRRLPRGGTSGPDAA